MIHQKQKSSNRVCASSNTPMSEATRTLEDNVANCIPLDLSNEWSVLMPQKPREQQRIRDLHDGVFESLTQLQPYGKYPHEIDSQTSE